MIRSALVSLTIVSIISAFLLFTKLRSDDDSLDRIDQELRSKLSSGASIVHHTSGAPRWSAYHAPIPGTIVNIATENDVIETVKYCIDNNLNFFAQSGAHGLAKTFNITKKDVIINMRGLNQTYIDKEKDTLTFEGGALVGEVVEAAYNNGVETTLPTCSCVGMSGATLGGGFNRLIGRYGFLIDNLLSINLVTADAKLITVTPDSHPDLWWALRGAGANFGVVTSMTMRTYPPINNGIDWFGVLNFSPDKLENLMQTLNDFEKAKEMFIFLVWSHTGLTPSITLICLYAGSEAEGKAALKSIYDVGTMNDISQEVPAPQFHHMFDHYCDAKGLRRPSYTVGLKKIDPQVFRKIWNEYVSLVSEHPDLNQTAFLIEAYSPDKIREVADSDSAFPHRRINFLTLANLAYDDTSLDPVAEQFGKKVRELWKEGSGFEDFRAYVNYAHGDEGSEAIHGENLPRLKEIKKIWDQHNRFGHFFSIPTEYNRISE